MRKNIPILLLCVPLVMGTAEAPPPPVAIAPGYLDAAEADLLPVVPPAPTVGDARDTADRRIFHESSRLEGSERWRLAAADGEIGPDEALKTFSCAMGFQVTAAQAPRLTAMVNKVMQDGLRAMTALKDHYRHLRPYHSETGPTCRPTEELGASYDYPSGHTMYGWVWANILAQAMPDRGTAILARGRAYGESRYICGVHNHSAVEAGWLVGSALVSLSSATSAYQADLRAVRRELSGLRVRAPQPEAGYCRSEANALGGP